MAQSEETAQTSQTLTGVLLALGAALAFGVTIPVMGLSGATVGPYTTAALLYTGASLASLAQKPFVREAGAPLSRRALIPLAIMAVSGAAVAPTLLAWGLQRTGPVTGGLMLNLEAVWSVVFARIVFGEFLGRRVVFALMLMTVAGVLLSVSGSSGAGWNSMGALAVLGATVGWALDNTASRKLAELKPLTVVAAKGALGASITASLAFTFAEPFPVAWRAVVLLLVGATGYGFSLRFYLLAQRRVGAARTASVFALAPFIGAALGLIIAPTHLNVATLMAAILFAVGVALHLSEQHEHSHRHEVTDHEHSHRHDDGHHTHHHDEKIIGEHSHPHHHDAQEHSHEHSQDLHHEHTHREK